MNLKYGMSLNGMSMNDTEPSSMDLNDVHPMKRQLEFVERVTRIVRLLTWTVLLAVALFVLGILVAFVTAPAWAEARADDPKAVARELGRAGLTAAGAIAKDAGKAATVPGYAGTALTEAGLEPAAMADAARRALADPTAPGAAAGRAVIEGAASRPPSPVSKSDPMVQRTETVAADPYDPALNAGDLASGSMSDCTAGLEDTGDGGACGGVTYCAGAGCETVRSPANTGFTRSAAMLNMVMEMGGEVARQERANGMDKGAGGGRTPVQKMEFTLEADRDGKTAAEKVAEPPAPVREKRKGMDLEL